MKTEIILSDADLQGLWEKACAIQDEAHKAGDVPGFLAAGKDIAMYEQLLRDRKPGVVTVAELLGPNVSPDLTDAIEGRR